MGRSENRDSRCVNRHRSKSRGSISPRILQARGGSAARGGHRSTVTVAAGTLRRNCQSQPKMRRRVSAVIRLGFIIRASACTPAPFHRLASPDKTKRNPTRLSIPLTRILFLAIILFCEIIYFPRLKGEDTISSRSSTQERIFFTNVKEVSSDRDFE